MTPRTRILVMLLVVTLGVGSAMAQSRQPRDGDMAVAGNIGFARASDNDFDDFEILFNGSYEYYLDESLFLRGLIGFTEFEPDDVPGGGDVELLYVNANIAYAWTFDRAAPFVTGGIGFYDKDAPSDVFDDDIEFGLNVGGGVDIGIGNDWAIRFEGTFHGYSGGDPDSFGTGTIGAKWTF